MNEPINRIFFCRAVQHRNRSFSMLPISLPAVLIKSGRAQCIGLTLRAFSTTKMAQIKVRIRISLLVIVSRRSRSGLCNLY